MTSPGSRELWRWVRYATIAAMLWSLVMALAFFHWAGEALAGALRPPSMLLVATAIAAFVLYHLSRFARWDLLLRIEGYRVPRPRGLSIFMAGIALTPTPAKAGVAARSVLLVNEGVPVHVSIAAYFAERLLDLIGLVLLSAFLVTGSLTRWLVLGALALAAIVLVAATPRVLHALRPRVERHIAIARGVDWAARCFEDASGMLAPARLPLLVAIGMFSNAAAGIVIWAALIGTATPIDTATAVGILGVSHLSGSISMLPGGLGGFDIAMLAQLHHAGVAASDAIVALLAVRLATFWSGVAAGLPLLWMGLRRSADAGPLAARAQEDGGVVR